MKSVQPVGWQGRGLASAALLLCLSGASAAAVGRQASSPKKSNLLQSARLDGNSGTVVVYATGEKKWHQQPTDFFVKDFERMDELPNYNSTAKKQQCHPKCTWTCGTSNCNSHCHPRCQAPKCVTACKKPTMAKCKRVCKDPVCMVVCPPQCSHGTCPKCKTVCGEPVCNLECGQGRCESQCADPDCVWDCAPDPVCAKPLCKLNCDTTVCTFGKDQKLPTTEEAPYLGEEIAWKGLGKIPGEHLAEFAPKTFTEPVQLWKGAKTMEGSQPLPKEGLSSITGKTGVQAEAAINKQVNWVDHVPGRPRVLAPNTLTTGLAHGES